MAGLRIRHRTKRGRLVLIEDGSRPFLFRGLPSPLICGEPRCLDANGKRRVHRWKTYHLWLDDQGTVIVSAEIWARLATLPDRGGFEPANVIERPPAQKLVVPGLDYGAKALIPRGARRT